MIFQKFLKQKNSAHVIAPKYAFEKRLFKALVAVSILSLGLYVYSLSSVVYGVVQRRTLEKDITKLHSDIGSAEAEYLLASNMMTYDTATVLGYVKPNAIVYESQERVAFNVSR